jgi:hypothetical protein
MRSHSAPESPIEVQDFIGNPLRFLITHFSGSGDKPSFIS